MLFGEWTRWIEEISSWIDPFLLFARLLEEYFLGLAWKVLDEHDRLIVSRIIKCVRDMYKQTQNVQSKMYCMNKVVRISREN